MQNSAEAVSCSGSLQATGNVVGAQQTDVYAHRAGLRERMVRHRTIPCRGMPLMYTAWRSFSLFTLAPEAELCRAYGVLHADSGKKCSLRSVSLSPMVVCVQNR